MCSSSTDLRQKFENQFRGIDASAQGIIRKDDFVNVLFDISKDFLQPSQILSIVQQLTTSLDDAVNYYEFLKLLDRAKAMSISEDVSQDGAGPHLINAMREQIHARIGQLSQ